MGMAGLPPKLPVQKPNPSPPPPRPKDGYSVRQPPQPPKIKQSDDSLLYGVMGFIFGRML